MPVDLHIIRASEFVCLDARERLDLEASKKALATLARACQKRGIARALLDLRELPIVEKPLFSPSELALLVETFREVGFTREQRLAILYKTDPHHGARVFAFIGRLRGWHVQAFAEFEPALLWLSEENSASKGTNAEEVPIRFRKQEPEENSFPAQSVPIRRSVKQPRALRNKGTKRACS